jgi:hypothetical protein
MHTEALRDPAWPQPTGHFGVDVTEAIAVMNAKIRQAVNEAKTATFTPPKVDAPLSTQQGAQHGPQQGSAARSAAWDAQKTKLLQIIAAGEWVE